MHSSLMYTYSPGSVAELEFLSYSHGPAKFLEGLSLCICEALHRDFLAEFPERIAIATAHELAFVA